MATFFMKTWQRRPGNVELLPQLIIAWEAKVHMDTCTIYFYVCKWFEYDAIKKMTMQIMTNWSKILRWSTLFESRVRWAKEVGKFPTLHGEMGWWALFAHQHDSCNIYDNSLLVYQP